MPRFPLASSLHAHRLLLVGGVYVDVLLEVEEYPEEDSACRMLSCTRKRGGNAVTSCVNMCPSELTVPHLRRFLRAHTTHTTYLGATGHERSGARAAGGCAGPRELGGRLARCRRR